MFVRTFSWRRWCYGTTCWRTCVVQQLRDNFSVVPGGVRSRQFELVLKGILRTLRIYCTVIIFFFPFLIIFWYGCPILQTLVDMGTRHFRRRADQTMGLFHRCNAVWLALCHTRFITALHFKLCVGQTHRCNDGQVTAHAVHMHYFNLIFHEQKTALTQISIF